MKPLALLCVLALVSATPKPPAPPSCLAIIKQADVSGKVVTPQTVGEVFGAALALRLGVRQRFNANDLRGAERDLEFCFQFDVVK